MRGLTTVLLCAGVGLGAFGCETLEGLGLISKDDEKSGGDHVRGKAKDLPLNETVDDHVTADDGDHTDWKKFVIGADTTATLDAWWDDPAVEAIVYVRDQFGGQIFELKHAKGQRHDHFPDMKFREGEYFLEVKCESGASVYTLEFTVAGAKKASGGGDLDRPE